MGRSYPTLSIKDFGTNLLETNDLDPIYVALYSLDVPTDQLHRWLIAYWCFYHAGVASYLSEFEGQEFWQRVETASANEEKSPLGERWPRGSERRHFRGKNSEKAVDQMRMMYELRPEDMVDMIVSGAPNFKTVCEVVKGHSGFGPWIAFKVADMVERVLGVDIEFDRASVFMFDTPAKAALMVWRDHFGYAPTVQPKDKTGAIEAVVEHLSDMFVDYKAPPAKDRPIGLQEVETILCKWKSHLSGHYPLGHDTREIRAATEKWSDVCGTAALFLKEMP